MKHLFRGFLAYMFPGAIGLTPTAVGIEYDGAAPNIGGLVGLFNQLQSNGSSQAGQWNYVTDATGTGTWSAAVVPTGIVSTTILQSGQAAITKTTDTASAIIAAGFPGAFIGQTGFFQVANTNSATLTVAAGAGVTLVGTTTVITVALRQYQLKITNLANPAAPGAASTNTTTTTAAVAVNTLGNVASVVIPVTASTGMIANSSVMQVLQANGTLFTGLITAINTLNITVSGTNLQPINSGATVTVFNNAVSLTGMYQIGANVAA